MQWEFVEQFNEIFHDGKQRRREISIKRDKEKRKIVRA
jgi:hypothetical protein